MTESNPVIELDFGVAAIYVQGSEDDSIQDVNEVVQEHVEDMPKQIKELKE